jgi:hypothetical protein
VPGCGPDCTGGRSNARRLGAGRHAAYQ